MLFTTHSQLLSAVLGTMRVSLTESPDILSPGAVGAPGGGQAAPPPSAATPAAAPAGPQSAVGPQPKQTDKLKVGGSNVHLLEHLWFRAGAPGEG